MVVAALVVAAVPVRVVLADSVEHCSLAHSVVLVEAVECSW